MDDIRIFLISPQNLEVVLISRVKHFDFLLSPILMVIIFWVFLIFWLNLNLWIFRLSHNRYLYGSFIFNSLLLFLYLHFHVINKLILNLQIFHKLVNLYCLIYLRKSFNFSVYFIWFQRLIINKFVSFFFFHFLFFFNFNLFYLPLVRRNILLINLILNISPFVDFRGNRFQIVSRIRRLYLIFLPQTLYGFFN